MSFVKKKNPEYTYTHKIITEIKQEIIKEAEENPTAAEQLSLTKGDNFIWCVSKKIFETKVVGDALVFQTTNRNYKPVPVLKLVEMIPATALSKYYNIIPKAMKKALKPKTYITLITRLQGIVIQ